MTRSEQIAKIRELVSKRATDRGVFEPLVYSALAGRPAAIRRSVMRQARAWGCSLRVIADAFGKKNPSTVSLFIGETRRRAA